MDIIARNKILIDKSIRYLRNNYINILYSNVGRKSFNQKITKKIKHLEKQLDEKQNAANISLCPNNQRTDKKPVIAIDNYNNILKEYDRIFAASKELQINSGIIIYSCENIHTSEKCYTFCYFFVIKKINYREK